MGGLFIGQFDPDLFWILGFLVWAFPDPTLDQKVEGISKEYLTSQV